jgi:histidinol dehydrogenase
MKTYYSPTEEDKREICIRPAIDTANLTNTVRSILNDVRDEGDAALYRLSEKFDKCNLSQLEVTQEEKNIARELVSDELKNAIALAKDNIEIFHKSQIETESRIETSPGVQCWRKSVGIEKVGLYIPGGSAPLFSTVLMLGVPAILAGCKEVILTTPPSSDGSIAPEIIYTAEAVGINSIYKVGGAQAIAALSYGTESIPSVSKIFGPGNQFVTKAKELVQVEGVAIDMPAGPSEVLVIADESCKPAYVAADLLSQAEHGADSQVVLLTTSDDIRIEVEQELSEQLEKLPRKETARAALDNSRIAVCKSIEECFELSNKYAPEHLILASEKAEEWLDKIVNAGSVFIGNYSCESAGDYASGTNHTLPTNGFAKNYSGVSVDSFVRKVTFQKLSAEGIKNIGPSIELMAEAEQLMAHKNAVTVRLKTLDNV